MAMDANMAGKCVIQSSTRLASTRAGLGQGDDRYGARGLHT